MYSNSLYFGLLNDDVFTDDFKYSEDSQLCSVCNEKYNRSYITYLYNSEIKTRTCFLCNSIINLNHLSLGKCFLICSELDQIKINKKTNKLFNESSIIPNIKKIDSNAKIINMSTYLFFECFLLMDKKEIKKFENIKIAFTGEASNSLKLPTQNFQSYFDNIKNANSNKVERVKYDSSYFDLPVYEFSETQQQILNNKIIVINKKNLLSDIKLNLEFEEKNTNKLINLVDSLNSITPL